MSGSPPSGPRLRRWLRLGVAGAAQRVAAREELGLPEAADDRALARALVQVTAALDVAALDVRDRARVDARPSITPPPVPDEDPSFLGELSVSEPRDELAQIDDTRTLLAVLRAGTLRQRRAVLEQLGEGRGSLRSSAGRSPREVVEALDQLRDVELGYELSRARMALGGASGRAARTEAARWAEVAGRLEVEIDAFWEGSRQTEPLVELPGDERAQVLLRARDWSDTFAAHLRAVIEGADGMSSVEARREVLSSLRHCGDARLIPALATVLRGGPGELVGDAARVLSSVDDPRVQPLLRAVFERTVDLRPRLAIAGALGAVGDHRAAGEARAMLATADAGARLPALEALETLGGTEDTEAVAAQLGDPDPAVASQAVRTLRRVGDGRALEPLRTLGAHTHVSALRAEIEDAVEAIEARLDLRGEEPPLEPPSIPRLSSHGPSTRPGPRLGVRLVAGAFYLAGLVLLAIGALHRGVTLLERAAARRARWAPPLVAEAMALARRQRYAQALAAFRRAIEADRARVERNPVVVRSMARCFLRRAEEMARDARVDVARGLLREVLQLDLRRAPAALRFELERRHALMREEPAR
ncbi:MAG: HEAT repeat domain-containing protein [Myxococcales bacterium]|nr:HEAT repeat domain-containing protein [Myxococcales bacterium]